MQALGKEYSLESFDDIYCNYYNTVMSVVKSFRFGDPIAEDLVQDVFVQVWTSYESLKDTSSMRGWIHAIARNKCLDELRKQKKSITFSDIDVMSQYFDESEVSTQSDPMNSYHLECSIHLLTKLIENHKSEPRATIAKMFYLDRKTIQQISETMKVNKNTTLSHLRRFRMTITKAFLKLSHEMSIESISF